MSEEKSINVKLVAISVALSLVIGAALFYSSLAFDNPVNTSAINRAEWWGNQLISQKFIFPADAANDEANRGLASTTGTSAPTTQQQRLSGEVGRDPWGFPFKYKVVVHDERAHLVVWSEGENQVNKKTDDDLKRLVRGVIEPKRNVRDLVLVLPLEKTTL